MKRFGHPYWSWLTTALLVVAALLPAGMMPVSNNLHIQVRFCSENPLMKAQTLVIERDGASQWDDMGDVPCPFAMLAVAAALPPADALSLSPPPPVERQLLAWADAAPGLGLAAPPPRSTGPPLI